MGMTEYANSNILDTELAFMELESRTSASYSVLMLRRLSAMYSSDHSFSLSKRMIKHCAFVANLQYIQTINAPQSFGMSISLNHCACMELSRFHPRSTPIPHAPPINPTLHSHRLLLPTAPSRTKHSVTPSKLPNGKRNHHTTSPARLSRTYTPLFIVVLYDAP